MNVLIVGGAGYIGGTTAHFFHEAGHTVTILDNLSTGHRHNISDLHLIEGDCGDIAFLDRHLDQHTFDVVLHFAAKIRADESMEQPLKYFQNNTFNAAVLIDACARAGVKNLIFSSTAAVYSSSDPGLITEERPVAPPNPYGRSKYLTEQILTSYQQTHNLNWLAFRYFNAAGAYHRIGPDYPFLTQLIPRAIKSALVNKPFTVLGSDYDTPDGTCVRDFIHVVDIARAHIAAAEKMVAGTIIQRPVNLGSQQGFSVLEVIKMVERVTGKTIEVQHLDRRPGDSPQVIADASLAAQLFDWRPQHGLEKMVRDAYVWQSQYRPR
jgi:UDP-glucose 4-epimerase